MLVLALLIQAGDPMEAARARLTAERHCVVDPDSTDVTVCGMRQADRFRVPFVVHDPGDPQHQAVMVERKRLLAKTTPLQERGPFLVGGGHAGVTVTANAGGVRAEGVRPLAP